MCVTYILITELEKHELQIFAVTVKRNKSGSNISEVDETTPDIYATMYLTWNAVGIATGYELDN
jgi:hypothetical protein